MFDLPLHIALQVLLLPFHEYATSLALGWFSTIGLCLSCCFGVCVCGWVGGDGGGGGCLYGGGPML